MTSADDARGRVSRHGAASVSILDDAGRLTCRIAGEVDLANSGEIFAALSRSLTAEHEELVVDLSETSYIDSAGLSLLVDINNRLRTRRTGMVVAAPPGSAAARLLSLSGLDKVIAIEPAPDDDASLGPS